MAKYVKIIGIIFILVILLMVALIIYELETTPFRQTKDFAVMYVAQDDVVDGSVLLFPPEEYSQLLQIDLDMRKQVADYMIKNNLKLKSGKQEFVRNNPNLDELISDGFIFEKID